MSARIYGRLLRAQLREQGTSREALARLIGVSPKTVYIMTEGKKMPKLELSARIAEAIPAPKLHDYVLGERSKVCPVCEKPFIADHHNYWKECYCSASCCRLANLRRRRARERAVTERRSAINSRRIGMYQEAVDAYCRGCEPLGICVTPDCALREVSPLPLAKWLRKEAAA